MTDGSTTLRWERHAEFTTCTWDAEETDLVRGADGRLIGRHDPPGALLVAVRLDLVRDDRGLVEIVAHLDPSSLAGSRVHGGLALISTDFQLEGGRFLRLLVVDRRMVGAVEAGPRIQRLLELETYRTFALLGLPTAQRLLPEFARIEADLVRRAAPQSFPAARDRRTTGPC